MLALCFTLAFAGATLAPGSVSVTNDGGGLKIKWSTSGESNTLGDQFEVRRNGISIGYVPAKGSPSDYVYLDQDVFKTSATTTTYTYQIFLDGAQFTPAVSITYTSTSSVKRTWGSLKAMFR